MTDKPSIRAILEHYQCEVPMRGRREVSVLCPIHEENRPSCSVNEEEGLIHCLSCGFGGDAYSVVMKKENCDYRSAVSIVEGITGEVRRDVSQPARRERVGISGGSGTGYRPRYRNTPPRRRPLSAPGP